MVSSEQIRDWKTEWMNRVMDGERMGTENEYLAAKVNELLAGIERRHARRVQVWMGLVEQKEMELTEAKQALKSRDDPHR